MQDSPEQQELAVRQEILVIPAPPDSQGTTEPQELMVRQVNQDQTDPQEQLEQPVYQVYLAIMAM